MKNKNKKILVFDLGNTTCHFGLFKGKKLLKDWRIQTKKLFDIKKIALPVGIEKIIGCSVVPQLDSKLKKLLKPTPIFINHTNIPFIKIKTDKPEEVGADRLVNALAVFKKYRRDAIIIDAGTAITIDLVSKKGEYLGGIIFPGINLCFETLAQKTAKLPLVTFEKPKNLIGKNTVQCIRSGVYYGIIAVISYFIKLIKKDFKKNFLVLATGGSLEFLSDDISKVVDIENKILTLEGLLETIKS